MNWRSIRKACTPSNVFKYLKDSVASSNESNTRLVCSIMLGSFLATSPFWGIQSFICVVMAYILRLNKVLSTAVASLNFPFIPVILFTSYTIGCYILNQPVALNMSDMNKAILLSILKPYLIGSAVLSTCTCLISGAIFSTLLHYTRKVKA